MQLNELKTGESAVITTVGGEGALRQHFLDMGVIPGAKVTLIKLAPMGDPMELRIHGYSLTLRIADAEKVEIRSVTEKDSVSEAVPETTENTVHPGLGEGGRFHDKVNEHPLPEGEMLTFALAGNQNSGKTTLFNQLTGANQHVGNFPGVTVDRKTGAIRGFENSEVTDLPGIYSLSPYSEEEIVSRQFILESHPRGIINIVDATNIERNLYLTLQLMELQVPMVLALNMMDEVRGNGGSVDINAMEQELGIPVIPISAIRNEGIRELTEHAVHVARYQECTAKNDFCAEDSPLHRCLHGIMILICDHAAAAGIPLRFAATKLVENDPAVAEALKLDQNEKETIEHIIVQMEDEGGLDRSAAIADMRFSYIEKIVAGCVKKPKESREAVRSEKTDRILTGKWTAFPSLILIIGIIFRLTFVDIGPFFQDLLDGWIGSATDMLAGTLDAMQVNPVIRSLVIDGICSGVGTVLSFLPIIIILFFFLSLLEDTGYMARIAFVTDKLLRRIGLSGRSVVPMLIGFGCSVPGVMATRTLPSERDRKLTILLIPFMSCTAKLPIYSFFAAVFFPERKGLIMVLLYVIGILVGLLTAYISKQTVFKGEAVPFVMELPNYRMPGWKNVLRLLWDKSKDFITRAFTVIFAATIVIWFLQTFDLHFNMTADSSQSILALLSGWIAPIFKPAGFGDWRVATALISGFMAKESVVMTLTVLFGNTANLQAALSTAAAFSLLIFCLLYTPCVAAISAVKREMGGGWAFMIVLLQCGIAWLCSVMTYLLLTLI